MLRWTIHLKGTYPLIQGTSPQFQGATAVAVGQKVYSFLGSCDSSDAAEEHGFQVEVHVFNTVTLRWTKLPPATAALGGGERPLVEAPSSLWGGRGRCSSAAVAIEEVVYVWGRSWRTTDYYDALYAYDAAAHRWRRPKVTGRVPEARDRHSSCVLGRALYVCGGYTRWSGRTDSVYRLDTDAMVWSLVAARGTPPPASEVQSATVIGTRMFVLFGGAAAAGGSGHHSNVRAFDTETECWLSGNNCDAAARPGDKDPHPTRTPPPAEAAVVTAEAERRRRRLLPGERDGHSAFAYSGELYVLGGGGRGGDLLWKFNPESFSWSKVEPKGGGPPPAQMDGMCSGVVVGGDRVVLFGGADLFVLDLSPSLKTLSKLALIRHARTQRVPHCVRWELSAMLADPLGRRSGRPTPLPLGV